MQELSQIRTEIDKIDEAIVKLLNERIKKAKDIGKIKKEKNLPIHHPEREREILEKIKEINKNSGEEFPEDILVHIFKEIMSACLSVEEKIKIAYLGPKATFTHQAALSHFGTSAIYIPAENIKSVFELVEKDITNYGVVPIENSIEGVVNYTIDLLNETSLNIVGEIIIPIHLNLLSKESLKENIEKVYSHKQALPQCRNWLSYNLPKAKQIEVESTAKACEIVLNEEKAAAIASEAASFEYGLNVLAKNIEDQSTNCTRFLIIGKNELDKTGKDKTSIIIGVKNKVGSLYEALEVFYKNNINLTKIESRPSKKKAWDYLFYIDLEGHKNDEAVQKALEELSKKNIIVKLLGSYPKAINYEC